jgi:signal transduction histidine kinase
MRLTLLFLSILPFLLIPPCELYTLLLLLFAPQNAQLLLLLLFFLFFFLLLFVRICVQLLPFLPIFLELISLFLSLLSLRLLLFSPPVLVDSDKRRRLKKKKKKTEQVTSKVEGVDGWMLTPYFPYLSFVNCYLSWMKEEWWYGRWERRRSLSQFFVLFVCLSDVVLYSVGLFDSPAEFWIFKRGVPFALYKVLKAKRTRETLRETRKSTMFPSYCLCIPHARRIEEEEEGHGVHVCS